MAPHYSTINVPDGTGGQIETVSKVKINWYRDFTSSNTVSFLHSPSEYEEFSRLFRTYSPTEYVTILSNALNSVRRSDDLAAADIIVRDKGEGFERVLRSLIPPTSLLEVGSGPFVVFIAYAQYVNSTA